MESVSAQVVAAAKLLVLNPGEFELWKMRIEQYFLMTDYALWEVIVNGDSPPPKRTVDGIEQTYPPQLQKRKDMNLKLLRSLPSEWKTHTLIWRNKPDLETLSMDDFTNEAVKTTHGVFAVNSKDNASTLPNVDSLRDGLEVADGNADNESKEISQEDMKESRAPKHQYNRNREITKRTMPIEETTYAKALVAQDGFGYDWSDQAKEGPTNFALMAYTSLGSSSSSSSDTEISTCSKAFARTKLRKKFKKAEKERDDLKLTLENFENSSKNLSKLLDSQVSDKFKISVGYDSQVYDSQVFDSQENDKYKTGEGYHAVPLPILGTLCPLNLICENKNETESKSRQRKPSNAKVEFVKTNEHVKSPRESVKKKLGSNFEFKNKACYVCGSFNHLIKDCDFYEKKMVEKPVWNNARRVNHQNSQRMTHPHPKRNFVPRAVLMKSGLKTLNTARQNSSRAAVSVNTARPINTAYPKPIVNYARPASNVFNRAHSHVRRPFNMFTSNKNSNFNEKVNTVKGNVTTVGPKAVVSDEANDVKASAWQSTARIKLMVDLLPLEEIPKEVELLVKGIKREFSVARTPQQNGVAERKNRTLIEAARTMLANLKLPTTFWAEAVNTACYVQNMVLVIKPHNKTLYELFLGRKHALSLMRPFGCPVTVLNTLDHLGKFDGKVGEGFFVGYSTNSKAFKVFNSRTRIVEENLHVKFSEEIPNIARSRPKWLFDIDTLTKSMNYKPVVIGNQTDGNAGTKENIDACQAGKKIVPDQEHILLPLLTSYPSLSKSSKDSPDAGFKPSREEEKMNDEYLENEEK
ncbi:ribonuclease H-like domain-containing protein [Tanacetum coccineum]